MWSQELCQHAAWPPPQEPSQPKLHTILAGMSQGVKAPGSLPVSLATAGAHPSHLEECNKASGPNPSSPSTHYWFYRACSMPSANPLGLVPQLHVLTFLPASLPPILSNKPFPPESSESLQIVLVPLPRLLRRTCFFSGLQGPLRWGSVIYPLASVLPSSLLHPNYARPMARTASTFLSPISSWFPARDCLPPQLQFGQDPTWKHPPAVVKPLIPGDTTHIHTSSPPRPGNACSMA